LHNLTEGSGKNFDDGILIIKFALSLYALKTSGKTIFFNVQQEVLSCTTLK